MSKIFTFQKLISVISLIIGLGLFYYLITTPVGPKNYLENNLPDNLYQIQPVNTNQVPAINTNQAVTVPDWQEIKQQGKLNILGDLQIFIFAKDLAKPRVLKFDQSGNLLVSAMGEGSVYAFKPDGEKVKLLNNLNNPHGLEIKADYLYLAEPDKVSRYQYDPVNLTVGKKEVLFNLPSSGGHFTRTIRFGSDGALYVSVGSSCNVCLEQDERRSAILKYNSQDWSYSIFSRGLRNTVFFLENPQTKKIWGNDMGRDNLGDNLPPDELNILQESNNYGWPICYGNKINDRDFDKRIYVRDPCIDTIVPTYEYSAHNAPLGLVFIDSPIFPADWQGDLLVALHGSWNRSVPDGYKVVHLKVDGDKIISTEDFITGFLSNKNVIGRPVDLAFGQDGALYLSDDQAGVIYKIFK